MELYLHFAVIHSVVVNYWDDSSWETYKVWSVISQTGSVTQQGRGVGKCLFPGMWPSVSSLQGAKGQSDTLWQCLSSFGRMSLCTCPSPHFRQRAKGRGRRNCVCASSFALNLRTTVRRLRKC